MNGQFFYAVVVGAAIGIALCAMVKSPLTAWSRNSNVYRWGLLGFCATGVLLSVAGATVLSGAVLGLGFVLAVNGVRLNHKNHDQ